MSGKRVIQVYKAAGTWKRPEPPGIGDFIRGLCHLHEMGEKFGFSVAADISATEFWNCVDKGSPIFASTSPSLVKDAEELGDLHADLVLRIWEFMNSDREEILLSTNIGEWNRRSLPQSTKRFARQFYQFCGNISDREELGLIEGAYSVLSIRAGDDFFGSTRLPPRRNTQLILDKIASDILPVATEPIVVMSDSLALRDLVASRFKMLSTSTPSFHGAKGGARSVCRDLDLLAGSSHNFHINAWKGWWSGFSHYTSMIFDVPSTNFAPVTPPPRLSGMRSIARRLLNNW